MNLSYKTAMKIKTQEEADKFFEELVQHHMKENGDSRKKAEQIQRINLGYFAGYYDSETRERVERLFDCAHPVFGKISENGSPTAEEAFEAGKKWAKK